MADAIKDHPATEAEKAQLEKLRADFTAMAGEQCEGHCHRPMTLGQAFYTIGGTRRIYVCASCALDYLRGES